MVSIRAPRAGRKGVVFGHCREILEFQSAPRERGESMPEPFNGPLTHRFQSAPRERGERSLALAGSTAAVVFQSAPRERGESRQFYPDIVI